ncbi:MAG: L-aspartate oxidase [Deltaproteobacteria bacterium]|nr:L-aspartate oxidase [Deltaproteobacteria bacterium]
MTTDFLVLGSGLGGLAFALEAAEAGRVVVATKRDANESNTRYAQGGIATALGQDDSFELHVEDTLHAGAGLCHPDVVDLCVRSAPENLRWLIDKGVSFTKLSPDTALEESFDLGREGGHSRRRVLHAEDLTGREVERVLVERVRAHPNVTLLEQRMGLDLWHRQDPDGAPRVQGAFLIDRRDGRVEAIGARATVLATGGAGKVYLYTSNPDVATGDGVAMAWRAGARVANLEFFQFHPTCLYHPQAKSFLISEALRGEGGILRRLDGTAFMSSHHADREMAPRDVVARAIDHEMKRTGDDHVALDMTHLDGAFLEQRFPNIFQTCLDFGVDLRTEPIPVVPAAHYQCGGVLTDADGRSTVRGLYAVGEVAATGLHGANRLASNSLLEALVFGRRAAADLKSRLRDLPEPVTGEPPAWMTRVAARDAESVVVSQDWEEVRRLMWNYVGVVRSNRRLFGARRRLDVLAQEVRDYVLTAPLTPDLAELRNLVTVARLIVECALGRAESRGLHCNVDYPDLDDARFRRDTVLWAGRGSGQLM